MWVEIGTFSVHEITKTVVGIYFQALQFAIIIIFSDADHLGTSCKNLKELRAYKIELMMLLKLLLE